jgi:hypothetical protein
MKIKEENNCIKLEFNFFESLILGKSLFVPIKNIESINIGKQPERPTFYNFGSPWSYIRFIGPFLYREINSSTPGDLWRISKLKDSNCIILILKDFKYKKIVLTNTDDPFWKKVATRLS